MTILRSIELFSTGTIFTTFCWILIFVTVPSDGETYPVKQPFTADTKDTSTDIDIQTALDTINSFVENVKIAENKTMDIIRSDKNFLKVPHRAIKDLEKAKQESQGTSIPSFG
ncbi:hypothetical protein C0J52_21074 [Blattella germanica]|nr:hypothetical protein C0J52_21074 [Blattella germanica]